MAVQVGNLDGYVYDDGVNTQLHVDLSHVGHNPDDSVTLLTDQLWMTDVGKLAGKQLSAFKGVVDPRNWDVCSATKSFFVKMQEVPPPKPPEQWPKLIDETVRLQPTSRASQVTARLEFDFANTPGSVKCTYALRSPIRDIVVDNGWLEATKITRTVTDVRGNSGPVTFFRIRSSKTIKFKDGRQAPDPILATVWGWGARRLVECAS